MEEITLPPEENEETPQVLGLNIDKPTENSKVIRVEFVAKKTNKVRTLDTGQQLYTTDTDAWFEFKETSLEGANGTYSVVFRNRHDGSIFQRTGDVVNGVAYYKIPHQEIRHAGAWRGQIVYKLSNGDTTSREFGYDVKGHILDGKDVREIVVEDFETLMSQLRSMKDNAELELESLTQELRVTNDTAEQNETDRQVFFYGLIEDIDDLQVNYQELLDTGVLQTNINAKLEQLEEEYAPRLTEVTAQLAQTNEQFNQAVGAITVDSEVVLARNGESTLDIRLDKSDDRLKDVERKVNLDASYPAKGNLENGFYGFIQPKELGEIEGNPIGKRQVTATNLALAIGLPQGHSINEDTPFMKFSRKGEIYLVPVKPIRHSATWDQIYNAGAVYGDGTVGMVPPGGRAGKRLSVNAENNSFNIEVDSEGYGFLRSGGDTAKIGDTIVAKGFTNSENNGEFVVQSISNTSIVVNKPLKDEASAPKGVVYEKTKAVLQNKTVTIGGNRYRVQLLKGASQDPLNSYLDSDRDLVGPASEWNHLILPLHEKAKLQNWAYKAYAGTTEDWGVGLTDADLVTHHSLGPGSYTWCQETSDEASYRRVGRGGLGASYGIHHRSWNVYSNFGFRPALRLLS